MINTRTGERQEDGELESKLFRSRTDIPSHGIMKPPSFIQRLYESSGLEDIITTNITHNMPQHVSCLFTNLSGSFLKQKGIISHKFSLGSPLSI